MTTMTERIEEKESDEKLLEALDEAPPSQEMAILTGMKIKEAGSEVEAIESIVGDEKYAVMSVLTGAKLMRDTALEHEYYLNAFRHFDQENQEEWSENQKQSLAAVDEDAAGLLSLILPAKSQGLIAEELAWKSLEVEGRLEREEDAETLMEGDHDG